MEHHPNFRFSEADIELLRDRGENQWLIDCFYEWVQQIPQLDRCIANLERAFSGSVLGNGTGLREAQGLDDYASTQELARLRAMDEKTDWKRIDAATLDECYAAPTYMNAEGFFFHLPAFLIAELNDQLHIQGFIDTYLLCSPLEPKGWVKLLDAPQRSALTATLEFVATHPDYRDQPKEIKAIARTVDRIRQS